MTNTDMNNMTSEELFELAKTRALQEKDALREQNRERIQELRTKRKTLTAEYKKEMMTIEREIANLSGKDTPAVRRRTGMAQMLLDVLAQTSPMDGSELRIKLNDAGIDATYLSQHLAQLKRKGKITSPKRGVYAIS